MSGNWPDGWITATLKDADIPVNDFTISASSAWQRSTPMLPYTNNPFGLPAVRGKTLELMRTGYAMYPTMGDFRTAFAALIASPAGQALHDALVLDETYSSVWRAVRGLGLPANATETDYPSAVLDMTSQSYRDSVETVSNPADRKTSGTYGSQTAFGDVSGLAARSSAQTAMTLQNATSAVQSIPGRLS